MIQDMAPNTSDIIELSQNLLLKLKMGEAADKERQLLSQLEPQDIERCLQSDEEKGAFWVNVYNGYNLWLMKKESQAAKGKLGRLRFFFKRQIPIAGYHLSLIKIENGFLRKSKVWWALGYLRKPWVGKVEKVMRVGRPDNRVHFALNCGAMSCPPIRFYSSEHFQTELELATKSYLITEVNFPQNPKRMILNVSALFMMYKGDFGGNRGIIDFVKTYKDLPNRSWKLKFRSWDWAENLDSFQ